MVCKDRICAGSPVPLLLDYMHVISTKIFYACSFIPYSRLCVTVYYSDENQFVAIQAFILSFQIVLIYLWIQFLRVCFSIVYDLVQSVNVFTC